MTASVIFVMGFAIGFLLSYMGVHISSSEKANKLDRLNRQPDEKWSNTILESVNAENIRAYLK